jgi:hypothetical protein
MKISPEKIPSVRNWFVFTCACFAGALSLRAAPVASPGYSVSVFATAPSGFTEPDSITRVGDDIFVTYTNGAATDGSAGSSVVVRYDSAGTVLQMYPITGRNDGLKYSPYDHKIWALSNEDANPKLTILDPETGATLDYTFEVIPPVHGGGYDDVAFLGGKVYISASNPNTTSQNTFPSIVEATLVKGNKIHVTPILLGNAPLWNIATGKMDTSLQSDPDSLKVAPGGILFLTSQADGDLIFVSHPGTADQSGQLLHLTDGSSTQITVDDTIFPSNPSGTILVTDTSANAVYAVTSTVFQVGGAYAASDSNGAVGKIDLSTGLFTPIVTGMVSPHGELFVPSKSDNAEHGHHQD